MPRPLSPATRARVLMIATLALAAAACAESEDARAPDAVTIAPKSGPTRHVAPPPSGPIRSRLPDAPKPDPEAVRAFRARLEKPSEPLREVDDPLASGAPKIGGGDAPSRVTAMALEATARGEARGMIPSPKLWFAVLAEGHRATARVTLAPESCTTFIAEGGLGVIEADLFLTTGEGSSLDVVAEDVSRGPISVIGGAGRCFPNPSASPLTVDLHVTARRGGGPILARAYRRP